MHNLYYSHLLKMISFTPKLADIITFKSYFESLFHVNSNLKFIYCSTKLNYLFSSFSPFYISKNFTIQKFIITSTLYKSEICKFLIRSGNIDILKLNTPLIGTTDLNWHFQKKIRFILTRLPNSAHEFKCKFTTNK